MTKFYNKMTLLQKHIFGFLVFIFGFLIGGILSFCSADFYGTGSNSNYSFIPGTNNLSLTFDSYNCVLFDGTNDGISFYKSDGAFLGTLNRSVFCMLTGVYYVNDNLLVTNFYDMITFSLPLEDCNISSIGVFYNNSQSVERFVCNGDNSIFIDGYSSMTSVNTFKPYFNISYRDEDNQLLTESYDHSELIIDNGKLKKTYTGDNDWILSIVGGQTTNYITGYTPTFILTGETESNTGNVFNNFSDNALKVLLSNIPSYIQYITIFAILFFLFSFLRRFKRKR